jgi:hypothetical protein
MHVGGEVVQFSFLADWDSSSGLRELVAFVSALAYVRRNVFVRWELHAAPGGGAAQHYYYWISSAARVVGRVFGKGLSKARVPRSIGKEDALGSRE